MSLKPSEGVWTNGEFSFPIRVYYEDTDVGGMTYHARYVSFFERIRSESIRGSAADVSVLMDMPEEEGGPVVYVVRNINVTYHRQSTVGDILNGFSRVTKVRAAAIEIAQRIENEAGELVAEAELLVAIVDNKGRPKRWPQTVKAAWSQWMNEYQSSNDEGAS
ncbi:hotdog domain-containing protein [Temperatibacter marinus]|uniref:Hotdog domain-containing protein n=1 Tax=Temperatibacter marinus TaxID=1456591 RepID=A0AA52H9N7_9PROT|nr:thioesterase family protein [Temperatibacter marinus]WND01880.1 hotdog domain-containing protein [Temperatibacter marinus]